MSTTKFEVGDVIAVDFPFSDFQSHKRRPGLILTLDGIDCLIARVTSHPARNSWDVALSDWRAVGLPLASTVRLSKLATIDQRLIHHRVGHLSTGDRKTLFDAWREFAADIGKNLVGPKEQV